MTHPATIAFLLLVGVAGWVLVGYPLLMILWGRTRRPIATPAPTTWPRVSVIVAVRNEAERIEGRIQDLLDQGYPGDLQVVVAHNGCTDGTPDRVAEGYAGDDRVRCVESPASGGKAGSLNRGIGVADGSVIVFADARQRFAPGTVEALVSAVSTEGIGAASGRLVIGSAEDAGVEGVRGYWELETMLRDAESRTGSMIGCTGACYAVRKELFVPHPPGLILDDVMTPMRAVLQGFRVVLVPKAVAFDEPAASAGHEFGRKVRTLAGNLQILAAEPRLLSPFHNPVFFRYLSHRPLRVAAPICLALAAVVGLAAPLVWVQVAAGALALAYVLGIVGLMTSWPPLAAPAALALVTGAALRAVVLTLRGLDTVWQKQPGPST